MAAKLPRQSGAKGTPMKVKGQFKRPGRLLPAAGMAINSPFERVVQS